ncbi:hypothetical protein GJ689_24725 [Rhodoplanes serenus]|uniref:Uncharacterized protein n=1 Tax=Rhodoplanes serenus TaxID=200615 RepID=A0A9X5AVB0_9BRAD|nr:hypothetical protein [Rhodoplanes serenus]MTW19399.1 hypothetical protein [Rhodoplanes serenus]
MDIENDGSAPADDTLLADQVDESTQVDAGDEPEPADTGTDEPEGDQDAGDGAGDADEPEGDEDDEQPKRKKASGSERLKRRLAAAEAELATLRSRAPSDGGVTWADVRAEIGDPPREEDFGADYAAYDRARTAYEIDARQTARQLQRRAVEAREAHHAALREQVEAHQERVEEFAKKVPDFATTLQKASRDGLKASPIVERLVIESDSSAHLLYHLAKNPERLDRLNRMSEREAIREIGRIEARLTLPTQKTTTKAPPPTTPPKGGASAVPDPSKMTMEQYRKWREARKG